MSNAHPQKPRVEIQGSGESIGLAAVAGQLIALEAAIKQMLWAYPETDAFVSCFPERLLMALMPHANNCELVAAAQATSVRLLAALAKD